MKQCEKGGITHLNAHAWVRGSSAAGNALPAIHIQTKYIIHLRTLETQVRCKRCGSQHEDTKANPIVHTMPQTIELEERLEGE